MFIGAASQLSIAQSGKSVLQQVIVLNEGKYRTQATVGSYYPSTKTYQIFDMIKARFASDVIIDSGFIFVAADSLLLKYDLNTKQRLLSKTVEGIRELAVWNNQILVTRAATFSLTSYFQVYDKDNLNFLYELTDLSGKAAEVKVLNDTAYIAVNNWGTMGKLAVVDLKNKKLSREIDLGKDGLNPETVEIEKASGKVFTVNNLDWSNASVTKYDVTTAAFKSVSLNQASGCNGSKLYLNNVYLQASGKKDIDVFSTVGSSIFQTLSINKSLYGLGVDPVNGYLYVGNTDYSTYGKVFIYDVYGVAIDSFKVDISPGSFAFDVRTTAGIAENTISSEISVYPNPVKNELRVSFNSQKNSSANITLTDILGRIIYTSNNKTSANTVIPMQNLNNGIYILKVETESEVITKKIVKE